MGTTLKRLRPLPGAHWSLPLVLVLTLIVLITAFPCGPRPEGVLEAFLVGVVMAACWVNHLGLAPIAGPAGLFRLIINTLLDLFRLALVWLVVFIPLLVSLPTYQCYTDRMTVTKWLLAASETRSEVESRVRSSGSFDRAGVGLEINLGKQSAKGWVMDNGQIVIFGTVPEAALVLTPALAGKEIVWTCRGMPEKRVPTSAGSRTTSRDQHSDQSSVCR